MGINPKEGAFRKLKDFFTSSRWRWMELALLIILLSLTLFGKMRAQNYHTDEGLWIGSSYFLETFVTFDFRSYVWAESYWTLTQPHMTRYIIGLSRRIGGYKIHELNRLRQNAYLDHYSNKTLMVPEPGLLWWSRAPMAILTIASVLLLFLAARTLSGPLTAYLILILFLLSDYFPRILPKAMGEAPLLFFALLSALSCFKALRALDGQSKSKSDPVTSQDDKDAGSNPSRTSGILWLILAGIFCGLSGSSKLNGMAVMGTSILLGVLVLVRERNHLSRKVFYFAGSSILLSPAIAFLTFLLLNPYLYRSPITHGLRMVGHRVYESSWKQENRNQSSLTNIEQRWNAASKLLSRHSLPVKTKFPIGMLLGGLGILYLIVLAWRWFSKNDPEDSWRAAMVTLLTAASVLSPLLIIPLNYPRYYVFLVFFNTLFVGLGLAVPVQWLFRRVGFGKAAVAAAKPGSPERNSETIVPG